MDGSVGLLPVITAPAAIPGPVVWSYSTGGLVLVIGLVALALRGDWRESPGLEKLVRLGPIFYAAPVAAFGTQHFTTSRVIASLVPSWIPWHYFWTYLIGTCFILAALSVVTGVWARLSASMLALTFFLFVVLMDLPAWARNPTSRIAFTLALRELSFSGGALALFASLTAQRSDGDTGLLVTAARYFVTTAVLFFSVGQFMHGDHVPGIPLAASTPEWLFGHTTLTYLTAVAYAVGGGLLAMNRWARRAATALGVTVLFVVLVVYVPMAIVERASLNGVNFLADTLMFGGAVLLLAGALPAEASASSPVDEGVAPARSSTART